MGILDKAKDLLGKHDDKVDQTIDKVGDKAKERFQGHDEMIDKGTQMGKDYDFSGEGKAPSGEQPPPAQPPPPAEGER